MDPEYERKYYAIEERHAWSVARRDLIAKMLRDVDDRPRLDVVDIGCGSGLLVKELRALGHHVEGLDNSDAAIRVAHHRGIEGVKQGDGSNTGYESGAFDAVIASDVLEHILDEGSALHEWKRLLRPGGHALIYVPAFSFLWSEHDVVNRHFRRYSRSQLQSVALGAGFELVRVGYWNSTLFAPTLGLRMVARVRVRGQSLEKGDDFLELHPTANGIVKRVLLAENALIASGVDPQIGVSVYGVFRKPLADATT